MQEGDPGGSHPRARNDILRIFIRSPAFCPFPMYRSGFGSLRVAFSENRPDFVIQLFLLWFLIPAHTVDNHNLPLSIPVTPSPNTDTSSYDLCQTTRDLYHYPDHDHDQTQTLLFPELDSLNQASQNQHNNPWLFLFLALIREGLSCL